MPEELRELVQAVQNPNYDRRRKVGEDSVEIYKAGRRFLLGFYGDSHPMLSGLPCTAKFVDNGQRIHGAVLVKLLAGSSKVVTPKTLDDISAVTEVGTKQTLEQLLADGVVTIEEVSAAQKIIRARLDKEEEERQKEREAKKLAKQQESIPLTGITGSVAPSGSVEGAQ